MSVCDKSVRFLFCLTSEFCHLETMKMMKADNITINLVISDDFQEVLVTERTCLIVSLTFPTHIVLFSKSVFSEARLLLWPRESKLKQDIRYMLLKSVSWFECNSKYLKMWNLNILRCLIFGWFVPVQEKQKILFGTQHKNFGYFIAMSIALV